jgi:hypothetical protein
MSKLHIGKVKLFKTPESLKEIYDHIDKMPEESRAEATMVMGFTWNFLAEIIEAHNKFGGDAVSTGDEA